MSELKKCPFCGGEAELHDGVVIIPVIDENGAYIDADVEDTPAWVECVACGAATDGVDSADEAIAAWNRRAKPEITGETSDGYHTFNELYHHRAVLFSVICNSNPELAWKSKLHHDGTMYDGMFIVGIETPEGQATYHYDIDPYWEMFSVQELPKAPEWDGHTPAQAIERIGKLSAQPENEPLTLDELREELGRLEELALATNGDAEETYTNGYRWGHRNGQIEILHRILNIGDGTCESKCSKPERSEG
jgi:Lar family restriction alleviation protein